MKTYNKLFGVLLAIFVLTACNNDDTNDLAPTDTELADQLLKDLAITVNDNSGELLTGELPGNVGIGAPVLISRPDMIKTKVGITERIDLVFEISSELEEVYFSLPNATEYFSFAKDNSSGTGQREAVSFKFVIPDQVDEQTFCVNLSAKDASQNISAPVQICLSVKEEEAEGRIIYFADYPGDSMLSTLDFNTGEVADIGPTGFTLGDIAFLNNQLYGVTPDSYLIRIDPETGLGEEIGYIGFENVNALEGGQDMLYGATYTTGEFISIDPSTGAGTAIGTYESGARSSGDLVFESEYEFLYGTVFIPGIPKDQLIKIDHTTGSAEFLGNTGFSAIYGLAIFRDQLLGLTISGDFLIIDTETGEATQIERTDVFSAGGAAAVRR